MPASATQIFDFLLSHPSLSIERHELSSCEFGVLRRSLRLIVVNLREGGDQEACEISDRLRNLLSEWLTVPVTFDDGILSALHGFGASSDVEARWGRDIRVAFDSALQAAEALQRVENPVRARLKAEIHRLRAAGKMFRIYCHRRARPHFESMFVSPGDAPLDTTVFLHSVRDYREADTFDTLIKVGPLRSWGWGAAPDAIKAAPRFATLTQIVWAGSSDEPGFGYDPVDPVADAATPNGTPAADSGALGNCISWTPHVTQFGNDDALSAGQASVEDEFQLFSKLNQPGQKRRATVLHVDDGQGIPYPPLSRVISFDPNPAGREPIAQRLPGETLLEGMYVIRPMLGDVDIGGVKAEHGHYSRTWKKHLEDAWKADAMALTKRLREAGLNLVRLDAAIRHWCWSPRTVIHAPQQMRHFQILIQVLDQGGSNTHNPQGALTWWQAAWKEIRRSRGEAIQAGVHEQEIVEEQLLVILRSLLTQIREKSSANAGFHLQIPDGRDVVGAFLFFRVSGIEDGFLVPDNELKKVCDLNTLEQWRA